MLPSAGSWLAGEALVPASSQLPHPGLRWCGSRMPSARDVRVCHCNEVCVIETSNACSLLQGSCRNDCTAIRDWGAHFRQSAMRLTAPAAARFQACGNLKTAV